MSHTTKTRESPSHPRASRQHETRGAQEVGNLPIISHPILIITYLNESLKEFINIQNYDIIEYEQLKLYNK